MFLLLVFLLAKLAWKPILSFSERKRKIYSGSTWILLKMHGWKCRSLKSDNENFLKQAREERDKMLREAREAANRMKEEAQAEAKKSADKIIDDARAAIGIEKQAASERDQDPGCHVFS